jgi:hypothetical protein
MTRDFELDLFRIIQARQRAFIKVSALTVSVSAVFFALSAIYGWPMFFALIPIALIGPYVVNIANARCPHCQKRLHRTIVAAFQRFDRCSRCGFPR